MKRLSTAVHAPLSNMVNMFISDIQVPVIKYQCHLGDDNASQNVQGHTDIPQGLVPANISENGRPSSPWQGGPRGTVPLAPPHLSNTQPLQPSSCALYADIIDIPDSDKEEDSAALPSMPSRPSRTKAKPQATSAPQPTSAGNTKNTIADMSEDETDNKKPTV